MLTKIGIILLTFLLVIRSDRPKKVKEFHSGRQGYWNNSLELYDNSGFSYNEWDHVGYRLKDTGNYELSVDKIKLNSLNTIVKLRPRPKKYQDKFEKKYKNYKKFKNRTFKIENGIILISGHKKLKNSLDTVKFYMDNLFEVELDDK
jgi:hypothetical protein